MKKLMIALVALFAGIQVSTAQKNDTFTKDTNVASLTVGINNSVYSSISVPPLTLAYEYAIKDKLFDENSSLGIGGSVGYASSKFWKGSASYARLSFRAALHYAFVSKLDTYAGLSVGYSYWSYNYNNGLKGGGGSGNPFAPSLILGARYYFTPQFAAVAEAGYDTSFLSLGVGYKF